MLVSFQRRLDLLAGRVDPQVRARTGCRAFLPAALSPPHLPVALGRSARSSRPSGAPGCSRTPSRCSSGLPRPRAPSTSSCGSPPPSTPPCCLATSAAALSPWPRVAASRMAGPLLTSPILSPPISPLGRHQGCPLHLRCIPATPPPHLPLISAAGRTRSNGKPPAPSTWHRRRRRRRRRPRRQRSRRRCLWHRLQWSQAWAGRATPEDAQTARDAKGEEREGKGGVSKESLAQTVTP